jgi:hypothetical protein
LFGSGAYTFELIYNLLTVEDPLLEIPSVVYIKKFGEDIFLDTSPQRSLNDRNAACIASVLYFGTSAKRFHLLEILPFESTASTAYINQWMSNVVQMVSNIFCQLSMKNSEWHS